MYCFVINVFAAFTELDGRCGVALEYDIVILKC